MSNREVLQKVAYSFPTFLPYGFTFSHDTRR